MQEKLEKVFFSFYFHTKLSYPKLFYANLYFWNIHMQMRLQPLLLGKYTAALTAEKKLIIWKEYRLIYVPSSVLNLFLPNCISYCKRMVFCFKNCFDQLWEKIVIVIEKIFWKFEAEFANILRTPVYYLFEK